MKLEKSEKKIVVAALIGTVLITEGFTISQGNIKGKEDNYVSSQNVDNMNKYVVNKDEYKIVSTETEDIQKYTIYCTREFNSKEISYITNQLIQKDEKMKNGYELYLFTDEEVANSFDGKEEKLQKKVVPIQENEIQIQNHYQINQETQEEVIPKEYEILSVKENEGITKVEMIINNLQEPQDALAQIRLFGNLLRDENKDKDFKILNIVAYTSNQKDQSFEYHGAYNSKVINNIYETLN